MGQWCPPPALLSQPGSAVLGSRAVVFAPHVGVPSTSCMCQGGWHSEVAPCGSTVSEPG